MTGAKITRRAQAVLLSVTSYPSPFSRRTRFRLTRCSANREIGIAKILIRDLLREDVPRGDNDLVRDCDTRPASLAACS